VWLLDDSGERCSLWMAYVGERLYVQGKDDLEALPFAHQLVADHLMAFQPGWERTIEYSHADERLPEEVRHFHAQNNVNASVVAPLNIGNRTLGWIKLSCQTAPDCPDAQWWRVVLIEAIARQAALALHHNRIVANATRYYGVGIWIEGSDAVIHDNLIEANEAGILGGGIEMRGGSPTVLRNVIRGNSSQFGGGIHAFS